MQLKAADDREPDLAALTALAERPDVEAATRRRIEQELRQIRAGVAGERDAAYEIEFHLSDNRNQVTIHDLRLEVNGRVAQIDHLIINRLLDVWVLESKHFAEGVAINDHGEWTSFYGGHAKGIPSPVEQNRRHIAVLQDVFAKGFVDLPKRLGLTIKPRIRGLVLVSNGARITRPRSKAAQARVDGLDTVIKAEQLITTLNEQYDAHSSAAIAKVIGTETLERLGRELVALHRPMTMDWAARFGLPAVAAPAPLVDAAPSAVSPPPVSCAICGRPVSKAVLDYCVAHAERFGGRVLCYDCQRGKPAERAASRGN